MKAVTGKLPASEQGWAYEIKWDGMRVVAYVNDPDRSTHLRLETTRGRDAADRFPELSALAAALTPHIAVLDGEVVAFDNGRPSFERLQRRMQLSRPAEIARVAADTPVCYVIFDLLYLDGVDHTALPYLERRQLLVSTVPEGASWRIPDHHLAGGADLLEAARSNQLEGIVAKRQDSRYQPAKRSPQWIKIKVRGRQELVIGGWQPGSGHRNGQLGSLIVGYYDNDALRYAGRVGTGFKNTDLRQLGLRLADLAASDTPFNPPPPPSVARTAHWVRPGLVCEVAFAEWTSDGVLRHPSYLGLRNDKHPTEVVREEQP